MCKIQFGEQNIWGVGSPKIRKLGETYLCNYVFAEFNTNNRFDVVNPIFCSKT